MGEAAEKGKERWPQVRLGDLITLLSGRDLTPDQYNDIDLGIPYITGATNIVDNSVLINRWTQNPVVISNLNDILLTCKGTVGEIAVNTIGPCHIARQFMAIRPDTKKIDKNYLKNLLTYNAPILVSKAKSMIPGITRDDVLSLKIPFPPLPEQQRIAAVLDQVSSLIALRKAQLAKLDLLVKARFVEMFGTENEFSMWQCGTVADVANVFVGVVIKPAQYYTDKRNGIPAFRSQNIGCMKVKDNDWVYFTEEGHLKNKKTIINENDVLVVRSGTPGIACVASAKCSGYNAVDIIIVRPHQNQINPVFLAMFTNMPHGRNQIKEKTGGAAQQHLNIRSYESMKIIRPPLNLQNQFSAFVKQTNRSECEIQHGLIHLETLKKSLMQEYFG
ncbi:MAG TPA: restriction endonuclease subunit S [Methanocorpusculum sp.]|nr:restriction endonuclease subunit S [Methanocorpusculum sp.]HJK33334.1 restriction endonuclease subunit S [Methanocorpusculum sp.]HJK38721.1 restriction endonuclease subunit S [Methanocorpusculum sp.]HJK42955.1 restriction endonuclease subunit S [Methanocorpusculum sp.]